MNKGGLSAEHEGLVVQLLGEGLDLVELIADQFPQKGAAYYLQSFFLVLRQMGYFFTERSSPLASQIGSLTTVEAATATRIKTIRDAVGHRESKENYASPNIKLIGAMRLEKGDVEINYGSTRIWLLAEVLSNHRRYRDLFGSAAEMTWLSQHPMWVIDGQKLSSAEGLLTEKLRNPDRLLRKYRG